MGKGDIVKVRTYPNYMLYEILDFTRDGKLVYLLKNVRGMYNWFYNEKICRPIEDIYV